MSTKYSISSLWLEWRINLRRSGANRSASCARKLVFKKKLIMQTHLFTAVSQHSSADRGRSNLLLSPFGIGLAPANMQFSYWSVELKTVPDLWVAHDLRPRDHHPFQTQTSLHLRWPFLVRKCAKIFMIIPITESTVPHSQSTPYDRSSPETS